MADIISAIIILISGVSASALLCVAFHLWRGCPTCYELNRQALLTGEPRDRVVEVFVKNHRTGQWVRTRRLQEWATLSIFHNHQQKVCSMTAVTFNNNEVEPSCGNVFVDLGLPATLADEPVPYSIKNTDSSSFDMEYPNGRVTKVRVLELEPVSYSAPVSVSEAMKTDPRVLEAVDKIMSGELSLSQSIPFTTRLHLTESVS